MKKLKILHLTQFLGVGGLEKILFLLIQEQLRANHHVELVVYDYEQAWVDYFRSEGITVHSDFRKKEGYDRTLLKWLNHKVKSFDVIHTHDLNPLMYAAPLKVLAILKDEAFPRLIHTAHGMDHVAKRPRTKLYEKLCSYMTDLTVGVSPSIREFYLKRLFLDPQHVININNGTPVEFKPFDKKSSRSALTEKFRLNPEKKIWTCVARVLPLKNQRLLIEAARLRPDIEMLLIGPSGNDEYWKHLKEIKPSNVHMAGAQSGINEILEGSDYFVSASDHEGIPVAALEAGAKMVPCLLSNIPGHLILQQSAQKDVAVYFEKSNLNDLMNKMNQMESHPATAGLLALNLASHVKANFSSERMYNNYLKAYMGTLC